MTSISTTGARTPAPPTRVVATHTSYDEAQRAVDRLSDAGFPVERTAIVGRDLRLLEQVTGRLTPSRATLMGAASGAWFGLFVGLLLTLFETGTAWIGAVGAATVFGAAAGAVYGFVAHWTTHGERDFASVQAVVADRYELTVDEEHAQHASTLLSSRD